jgi:hypothetical protein
VGRFSAAGVFSLTSASLRSRAAPPNFASHSAAFASFGS